MRHPGPGTPPLFREIEHTADRGMIVEAAVPGELFEKAGLALFAIMVGVAGVEPRESRAVTAEAGGWAELLQHWLTELLCVFAIDGLVAAEVTVNEIGPTAVRGMIRGERFAPTRHEFYSEIKAVTYHDLAVTGGDAGWQARVIFDV
jgi:SHS2 domain-containing protein